jgi:hypothetical protein
MYSLFTAGVVYVLYTVYSGNLSSAPMSVSGGGGDATGGGGDATGGGGDATGGGGDATG